MCLAHVKIEITTDSGIKTVDASNPGCRNHRPEKSVRRKHFPTGSSPFLLLTVGLGLQRP
jgi:hypothetical protein